MPSSSPSAIVIDARPRGPRGPLAGETVLGRPVLAHLLELAGAVDPRPVAVHARIDEHETLRSLVPGASVVFAPGPPPENATILRADRLYDRRRLRRALHAGRDVESAVIWRLDRPSSLAAADEELARRRSYQPLGRFWALAPSRAIARSLQPTAIRPNAVTLASFTLMLGASAAVAFSPAFLSVRLAIAASLALALILDTADGHLARLQGTSSEFGRWLDAVLDELADFALHSAVAWSAFANGGGPRWLVLALVYIGGKYLFVIAQQAAPSARANPADRPAARPSSLAATVRLVGHADVRWHLWIALAALGRLELALIVYAAYFPARTLAIGARKAVQRA